MRNLEPVRFSPFYSNYFDFVCGNITGDKKSDLLYKTYYSTLTCMADYVFPVVIPWDANRVSEVKSELRSPFIDVLAVPDVCVAPFDFMHAEATVLEILVIAARKLEFLTSKSASDWFWYMFNNMGADRDPALALKQFTSRHWGEGIGNPLPVKNKVGLLGGNDEEQCELWVLIQATALEQGDADMIFHA